MIFLGAGASYTSGYPLANGLRLLISSRNKWEKALVDYDEKHGNAHGQIRKLGMEFLGKHTDALDLFRNGGFATIDEFCKLAEGSDFRDEINGLRDVLRAALGLFNPEDSFEKSEYYGFIQSLFEEDLISLREDITVLTYNYDPYLEFLLQRALLHRYQVVLKKLPADNEAVQKLGQPLNQINAATSGFHSISDINWLEADKIKSSFCVLKLHGAICSQNENPIGYKTLFESDPLSRAEKLFNQPLSNRITPILFPWEIMTETGFPEKNSFLFQNQPALYLLFRGIWERARRDIQSARKISFVGSSVHPFLKDGLKYLFNGKEEWAEICVANIDNKPWVKDDQETYWENKPHTSAYAINKVLKEVAPKMARKGKQGHRMAPEQMTIVSDFKSFIQTQMKPVEFD